MGIVLLNKVFSFPCECLKRFSTLNTSGLTGKINLGQVEVKELGNKSFDDELASDSNFISSFFTPKFLIRESVSF